MFASFTFSLCWFAINLEMTYIYLNFYINCVKYLDCVITKDREYIFVINNVFSLHLFAN